MNGNTPHACVRYTSFAPVPYADLHELVKMVTTPNPAMRLAPEADLKHFPWMKVRLDVPVTTASTICSKALYGFPGEDRLLFSSAAAWCLMSSTEAEHGNVGNDQEHRGRGT